MKTLNLRTLVLAGIVGIVMIGGVVPCMGQAYTYVGVGNPQQTARARASVDGQIGIRNSGEPERFHWSLYNAPNRYFPAVGNTSAYFEFPTNNGVQAYDDNKVATGCIFYRRNSYNDEYGSLFAMDMHKNGTYNNGARENQRAEQIYRTDRSDQYFCWEYYNGPYLAAYMLVQGYSGTSTR